MQKGANMNTVSYTHLGWVLMEQKKEAVYLINDERYLHLRENGAGVGFATYNKVTGEPLESGADDLA